MVVILLLCKKTHYLFHNNWLLFQAMSLISMVLLFRLLILICKMLLRKNLTLSDFLQETKNAAPDKSSIFSKWQFSLKELVSSDYFQNQKSEVCSRIKKKKKCIKKRSATKIEKANLLFQTYFVTLCLFEMHFLFFTGFRNICWFLKIDTEQFIAYHQNHSTNLAIDFGTFRASFRKNDSYSNFYKLQLFSHLHTLFLLGHVS